MLNLYERAVKRRLPVISGFHHLASVAVRHVRESNHTESASSSASMNANRLPVVDLSV